MSEHLFRIAGIVSGTSVDGPGLRTSIYFSGCRHRCPSCHNPQTWDFDYGNLMSIEQILSYIDENGHNVTFTGGDPLYHADQIIPLAREIKKRGLTIWLYTGFVYENIKENHPDIEELLSYVDVLVDGPFIEALCDTSIHFRGSSNQRLIDLRSTEAAGCVVDYKSKF